MFRGSRNNVETVDAVPEAPRLTASANSATGRATLAHALLCDGQYDAALTELEVALKDNPELADGQLVKGITLARKGRYHDAIAPLRMAMKSREHARDAALSLIVVYLRLDYHERAARVAQQLTRDDDRDALGHAVYGAVLSRWDKPEPAIVAFRRAAELDPELAPVRMRLGELLFAADQIEPSLIELVAAVRLAPMNARALQTLASILRRKGRGTEALAVYRRAIAAGQPTAQLFLAMAECFLEQKIVMGAVSMTRLAMTLDPRLPDCHRLLGRIYAEQGRPNEARQYEEAANRLSSMISNAEESARETASMPPRRAK